MNPKPEPEKAIKRSISFPPALLVKAQATADEKFGGNLSLYIRELLQRDQAGRVDQDRPDIILALMRSFDPSYEEEMKEQFGYAPAAKDGKYDQRRVVKNFLSALHRAVKDGFDPEWPFDLITHDRQLEWEGQRVKYEDLLRRIAAKVLNYPEHEAAELLVAEPAAKKHPRRVGEKPAASTQTGQPKLGIHPQDKPA